VRNYWRSEHADPRRVLDYAEQLGKGAVFKRLGYTAEHFAEPKAPWIARCREGMSAGVTRLDPTGPNRGRIVSRWRLRLNAPMGDQ
jgi:predicted transcriptional regulator of viral defense system